MAKVEIDEVTGRETTGHEWDGIKELNNPMPKWWVWVFWVSIVFSIGYWVFNPSFPLGRTYIGGLFGPDARLNVQASLDEANAAKAEFTDQIASVDITELPGNEDLMQYATHGGEVYFQDNCVPCHGLGGAGQGFYPTLADDDWIWGGTIDEIAYTIRHGIRNDQSDESRYSEMPRYGVDGILEREQIEQVASYILSINQQDREFDAAMAEEGQVIYEEQCAACHGEEGKGDIYAGAPNLTDAIWLYGGEYEQIVQQIWQPRQGVMPAFGQRLSDTEIKMLASYVYNLGGGQESLPE
ncbi:MAG: cytochrome-c oxidase, cbb3-type subunit III [Geminicoccaceae bacterium]